MCMRMWSCSCSSSSSSIGENDMMLLGRWTGRYYRLQTTHRLQGMMANTCNTAASNIKLLLLLMLLLLLQLLLCSMYILQRGDVNVPQIRCRRAVRRRLLNAQSMCCCCLCCCPSIIRSTRSTRMCMCMCSSSSVMCRGNQLWQRRSRGSRGAMRMRRHAVLRCRQYAIQIGIIGQTRMRRRSRCRCNQTSTTIVMMMMVWMMMIGCSNLEDPPCWSRCSRCRHNLSCLVRMQLIRQGMVARLLRLTEHEFTSFQYGLRFE
mmetsp:Transcript_1693/g.2757  ORF Transcript_1693/g.2757 Transcript_1693/m.2757 type:complete len:261 (+) Transcript_1693:659-1441(+)